MRVFLTGHNGFKGTWFTVFLKHLGHQVDGLSLLSTEDQLSQKIQLKRLLDSEIIGDIRNEELVRSSLSSSSCDVIVHFAAQSLVRESYRNPKLTFETNVNGTLNLLHAAQTLKPEIPILIITTDKVYRNDGRKEGYRESDPLGGDDPYSASKSMADLLVQSWEFSYPSQRLGVGRAGNVIGGGDVCKERLMPDLLTAYSQGSQPSLRHPSAIRPWQHVLDCLNGYLQLMTKLMTTSQSIGAWNIGPSLDGVKSVKDVATQVAAEFGVTPSWMEREADEFSEANVLLLNSSKANTELGWRDKMTFEEAIESTVTWHKRVSGGTPPLDAMTSDIVEFLAK